MQLHLVGGFLGSGKTTAILAACRSLVNAGKQVGILTNDQGKHLVDTAFLRGSAMPTVEVTGGCFCCNFSDLQARLEELVAAHRPDVIFAESVGSCADQVATVIKPLLELGGPHLQPASFSVFCDARLLLRWLKGQEMPYHEDVVYVFQKQIEESSLLCVNKIDLLPQPALAELASLAAGAFAGKNVLLLSALHPQGVSSWLGAIASGQALPHKTVAIDYARYGHGEALLAWVDLLAEVTAPTGQGGAVAAALVRAVRSGLQAQGWPVAHLKFGLSAGASTHKISFTWGDDDGAAAMLAPGTGTFQLVVNARLQAGAAQAHAAVLAALQDAARQGGAQLDVVSSSGFHPAMPHPSIRISDE